MLVTSWTTHNPWGFLTEERSLAVLRNLWWPEEVYFAYQTALLVIVDRSWRRVLAGADTAWHHLVTGDCHHCVHAVFVAAALRASSSTHYKFTDCSTRVAAASFHSERNREYKLLQYRPIKLERWQLVVGCTAVVKEQKREIYEHLRTGNEILVLHLTLWQNR